MAEYVPLYIPGKAITRIASAAITGGQLVRVSGSGTAAPAGAAASDWLGMAGHDAASGEPFTIYCEGVQRPIAATNITAGAVVESAANGQVTSHTIGTNDFNIVGLALTTAAAGAPVEVSFAR